MLALVGLVAVLAISLPAQTLCGDCKAVRILILGWDKHGYHPQHAVIRNGIWYAVHRD